MVTLESEVLVEIKEEMEYQVQLQEYLALEECQYPQIHLFVERWKSQKHQLLKCQHAQHCLQDQCLQEHCLQLHQDWQLESLLDAKSLWEQTQEEPLDVPHFQRWEKPQRLE